MLPHGCNRRRGVRITIWLDGALIATVTKRAKVAKLADAPDLGSGGVTHGGSSPPFRTIASRENHFPASTQPGAGRGYTEVTVAVPNRCAGPPQSRL